jgi:ferredoxin
VDLLRSPVAGRFLRWRHARTTLQLVLLVAAAAIVLHGFFGPDVASSNLATVLTWVQARGFFIIALVAVGNLFCAGCPFIRVRDWARRLHLPTRTWPVVLRGKWIAIVLFAAVLVAYEYFDLWDLPSATAAVVLGYFVVALAIDLVFRGASFCRHVCPIGQFNFVTSTVSPFEVRRRDQATCAACQTADCVSGRHANDAAPAADWRGGLVQRGCELGLFLPAKVGNLDCTFCLDCVQACPHDNVAIATRVPGLELADGGRRSVIGRLIDRTDLVVLVAVFVFGAYVNAALMLNPIHHALMGHLPIPFGLSPGTALLILLALGLLVVPAMLLGATAEASRQLSGRTQDRGTNLRRFVYGLVPLGVGMWAAHYGFHLLTGLFVVVPVAQQAVLDLLGVPLIGEPLWRWTGLRSGVVFPVQVGLIVLGLVGSLAVIQVISDHDHPDRPIPAALPWATLVVVLATVGLWILFQPMDMRGMAP